MEDTNPLAGTDELDSPLRTKYLGVIDRMRELGINNEISLPQLVVVGDQSSGKSSLLEGITGLSFPVAGDLCTRFATQLILRRCPANVATAKVSIIPGPDSDPAAKEHLGKFKRDLEASDLKGEELARILNEASAHMGLPTATAKTEGSDSSDDETFQVVPEKRFSNDVLKIELSGPEHHHLSVVDVPGLFHNPTPVQTAEDKEVIRNLIKHYIEDRRTIIMAVMDATSNLANQEVFKLARDADPDGQRTVGVVTKCDAVQKGDEDTVLRIAMNSVERLKHGWFGVRNRSTQEIRDGVTVSQRHQKEKTFFDTAPWNQISKDRRGVGPLKIFLGTMLFDHIRLEFPSLMEDMQKLRKKTKSDLDELGASRDNAAQQRRYLTGLATKYQRHVSDSLLGRYDFSEAADPALKLRKILRDEDDNFAERMRLDGHAHVFKTTNDDVDSDYKREQLGNERVLPTISKRPKSKKHARSFANFIDDSDLTPHEDCAPIPAEESHENIYEWIKRTYLGSRGPELPGCINPAIMELLFHEQSAPWEQLANEYANTCEATVKAYNEAALQLLVADSDARNRIMALVKSHTAKSLETTRAQLAVTVQDERGVLKTVNHYFGQTLRKCREERILARFRNADPSELKDFGGNVNSQAMAKVATLSNEDQAVNDIHDMLKAYYKVALKRFTDNVTQVVSERNLLGLDGPVSFFTPELVNNLSDDELAQIAGETYSTTVARKDCKEQMEKLEKALEMSRELGA